MSGVEFLQLLSITVGFSGSILIFWLNGNRQNRVMQLETYFKLENESSRLFEVARQNPKMMMYLDGKYAPASEQEEQELQFQLRWFVPQVLNAFELSISYKEQAIFDKSVFLTWVSWYHELSTAENFSLFWQDLREHYMPDLRVYMDLGVEIQAKLGAHEAGETAGRKLYFEMLGEAKKDPDYLAYFEGCEEKA